MKRFSCFLLVCSLALFSVVSAQIPDYKNWQANGSDVYVEGDVGIGVSSPLGSLHVQAKGTGWQDHVVLEGVDPGSEWNMLVDSGVTGTGKNQLRFKYETGKEAMTLLTNGRVGMGVANPTSHLHVQTPVINGKGSAREVFTSAAINPVSHPQKGTAVTTLSSVSGFDASGHIVGVRGYAEVERLSNFDSTKTSRGLGGYFTATPATTATLIPDGGPIWYGGVYGEVANTINGNPGPGAVAGVIGVDRSTGSAPTYAGYFQGRQYVSENVGIGEKNPGARLHLTGSNAAERIIIEGKNASGINELQIFNDISAEAKVGITGSGNALERAAYFVGYGATGALDKVVYGSQGANAPLDFWVASSSKAFLSTHGLGIALPLTTTPINVITIGRNTALDPIADRWLSYSSKEHKENITTLTGGLATLEQLEGKTYTIQETGEQDIGLIAEEVATVLPEVVGFDTEGNAQGIDYARLTVVLLEGIKELQEQNKKLTERIETLENGGQEESTEIGGLAQ